MAGNSHIDNLTIASFGQSWYIAKRFPLIDSPWAMGAF